MRGLWFGLAFSSVCSLPFGALAQGWSGEAAVGHLSSSGNSKTSSVHGTFALDYRATDWKNSFVAGAINTSSGGTRSVERYTASDKFDWNFDDRNYAFASVEYEKDLFGGVRERTAETLGYGRHLLIGPVHQLDAELGVGARQTEAQTVAGVRGEQSDEVIGSAALKYRWQIAEGSSAGQRLKVESGESNTYTESVTELRLTVIGNLFASLSYTVKHNSTVPADTQNTDTYSAVSLSYKFGTP